MNLYKNITQVNPNKISFLSLILMLLGICYTYAQNDNIGIEATIIDKETKELLPFVNIHVEGTYTGTVSNEEGKFELVVKEKYADNNIIFSFIGYDNAVKKVKDLKVGDTIYMKLSTTSLNEIKIIAKNKYRELVKEAINKIPENYIQAPTYLNAYYRELTKINERYTKFTDAATIIYYSGYNNEFDLGLSNRSYFQFDRFTELKKMPYPESKELTVDSRDQLKVKAVRSSDNLQDFKIAEQAKKLKDIKTSHLKWLENNEIGGGPLRLTGADKVKRREDFLNLKNNEDYKFSLGKKSSYNNLPVYLIKFKPKDSTSNKAKYVGNITIDEASKAIISYSYYPTKLTQKLVNQKFATQLKTPASVEEVIKKPFITRITQLKDYEVIVNFTELNSKWFLKRIKVVNMYNNSGDYLDDYTAVTESELVINNIETEGVSRLSQVDLFPSTFMNSVFNYPLEYDSDFWKNYSALIPTGIVGKALEDLESENSLEEQFQNK